MGVGVGEAADEVAVDAHAAATTPTMSSPTSCRTYGQCHGAAVRYEYAASRSFLLCVSHSSLGGRAAKSLHERNYVAGDGNELPASRLTAAGHVARGATMLRIPSEPDDWGQRLTGKERIAP